ncbi:hypothetical protein [Anaerocolumna xylanovorans]|uniref:Uncharacterized protein n=1 Tax=Anaerocolumna xylanovorans DSM 12503 TaxID=1121345 RepID=A0A1M7Y4G3_9FIRM|nr:hypothetical protein [Anaerocolumna xylanovorans]SHO47187.1 hypothetical protein SAMN02745217_01454 [Anaerocolumna xylanovorans DSM 12503]
MNESYFDGGLLQYIGWNLLGTLVTICTLGIYSFWLCIALSVGFSVSISGSNFASTKVSIVFCRY